jgi:hypothetical protein
MSKPLTVERLRKTNIYAGVLHLAQMAAVLALSSDFSLPVTATYMSGPPGTTYADPIVLFNTPIGLTVAIFLGLSAFFHFLVASGKFYPRYSAGLATKRNYFRWVEYSISSSVMIVLIAQVTGVADMKALVVVVGCHISLAASLELCPGLHCAFMYLASVVQVRQRRQHLFMSLS